ncbi:MAG: discoidin domain-containing protein [Phycisphaerae bacterium]|nr:discoidin domain-containing protein [Phycisphaerae bacterium]
MRGTINWVAGAMIAVSVSGMTMAQTEKNEPAPPGGAFNLRILSDSVPDFSTRENFVYSALSPWKTEQEKATAQFRWMHRSRRVGSCVLEDGRPVLDPVLFFNSYGVTFCSMISQINCSLWEARGAKGRVVDLPGHCVSEVFYDGAWHLFDNDFCNYYLNEKGAVASTAELGASRVHGNIADLKDGEYYLFDHCPTASGVNGRIFMGPSTASLIEVARDWYPSPEKVRPRLGYTGSHAGHRYVLGIRPGESYTRYWQPTGTGAGFSRALPNGKDPSEEGGQVLRNSRANGKWTWDVNVKDPATFFAMENVVVGEKGVTVKKAGKPAFVVLRVAAANVVTSAVVRAGSSAEAAISVSSNGGVSWQPAQRFISDSTFAPVRTEAELQAEIAGRLEFLVKIDLGAKAVRGGEVDLGAVTMTVITQVNPRALPALKLGANTIVAVSDGHYETQTFNPRLWNDQAANEVHKVSGFQGVKTPVDTLPTLLSCGASELVLKATTPRPIRAIRMAATTVITEASAEFLMQSSFDGGKQWNNLRHGAFAGWPADHRFEVRQDAPKPGTAGSGSGEGVRDVQMKYSFDAAGCGLTNVFAEVNYEPAGPFMPYDLTYRWSEWRDGRWVERQHSERIDTPYHKYTINVGGTRPPRMESVEVAAPSPERKTKLGYSDREDVGDKAARPGYRLERGTNVARGCKYEVNRPASEAFPDTGGKLLTDGMMLVSSFWGLQDINLSGKKNERRVGDLAVWSAGDELAVTVDLGKSQTIGGVRIAALQPNEKVLYPARMVVETSVDGKTFAEAGATTWEECFFPAADAVIWEGTDAPVYEKLPAGGILDFVFPVVFAKPVDARYVRFRLSPPADKSAGIALWELEVYDKLAKTPFDEPIALPAPPARP